MGLGRTWGVQVPGTLPVLENSSHQWVGGDIQSRFLIAKVVLIAKEFSHLGGPVSSFGEVLTFHFHENKRVKRHLRGCRGIKMMLIDIVRHRREKEPL